MEWWFSERLGNVDCDKVTKATAKQDKTTFFIHAPNLLAYALLDHLILLLPHPILSFASTPAFPTPN
jgi:hypothetical protein